MYPMSWFSDPEHLICASKTNEDTLMEGLFDFVHQLEKPGFRRKEMHERNDENQPSKW